MKHPVGLCAVLSVLCAALCVASAGAQPQLSAPADASASGATIQTVVGAVEGSTYSGDGGPATSAGINDPQGIAVDSAGDMYVDDAGNNLIRFVPASSGTYYGQSMTAGDIYSVVGHPSGQDVSPGAPAGFAGDGGPAAEAMLNDPLGVTVGPDGNLYIVDAYNFRIRMVPAISGSYYGQSMTAGDIYTVAGDGTEGDTGDGGLATNAELGISETLAVSADNTIYYADFSCDCIRKIAPDDTISTLSINIDDISTPLGIGVDAAGDLYYAAVTGNQIIKLTPDGVSSALAGTGTPGYSGDGGPAVDAELDNPHGLAVAPDGTVYFSDRANHVIRVISPQGIITTYAGDGVAGFAGDGGPALEAELNYVEAVALGPHGNLYIADTLNDRIREIQTGPRVTFTSTPPNADTAVDETIAYNEADGAPTQSVTCTLDGAPVICTTASAQLTALTLGPHVFTVTATSSGGQTASASATWTTIAPPSVIITSAPAASLAATSATITYDESGGGPVSSTTCTLNGASIACSDTAAGLINLTPGDYVFTVSVASPDSNAAPATATATFTVVAAPSVGAVVAGAQTATGAQLTGTVNPNGLDTTYFVEYGTDETYGQGTTPVDAGSGDSPVAASATLAGLSPGTIYHARLVLNNAQGLSESPDVTFTTAGEHLTVVITAAPSLDTGSETISYTETGDVSQTVCDLDSERVACSSTQAVISNLSVGVHNFEVQALGPNASSASATTAFTTAASPATSTPTVSDLSSVGALLSAQVNPDELGTTYYFQYGPSTAYGASTPVSSLDAGDTEMSVNGTLAGLAPAARYHARLVATNPQGSSDSPDITFTTASASAPQQPAPAVTIRSAPNQSTKRTTETILYAESGTITSTACTLDHTPVPCDPARAQLAGLSVGAHTFIVTVSGPAGTDSASVTFTVLASSPGKSAIPVAKASASHTATIAGRQVYTLTGASSRVANGRITTWRWYRNAKLIAQRETITQRLRSGGTYRYTLIVTASDGQSSSTTITVAVSTAHS